MIEKPNEVEALYTNVLKATADAELCTVDALAALSRAYGFFLEYTVQRGAREGALTEEQVLAFVEQQMAIGVAALGAAAKRNEAENNRARN